METKDKWEIALGIAQFLCVLVAAIWAYFRFRREGLHQPRIEFGIQIVPLGVVGEARAVRIQIDAENKGSIEHRFSSIVLRLRGVKNGDPLKRRESDNRLDFDQSLLKQELVSEKYGYYFVRPGVKQSFSFTTTIPANTRFVLAFAAFKYEDTNELHTTESTFEIAG